MRFDERWRKKEEMKGRYEKLGDKTGGDVMKGNKRRRDEGKGPQTK